MRTIKEIYKDYTKWLVKKTGDNSLNYDCLINVYGEDNTNVFLYKNLMKKLYNKNTGFFFFAKFIVGGLTEIGYPKPFAYNNLLRKWHKLINKKKYLCIEAARGHGKSLFFSVLYNMHDMFIKKHQRIILISASQEQANDLLDTFKVIVENNELLTKKKDPNKWASQRVGFNEGYILTAGIGSEILGQHVNRINVDDILRSDNKLSDEQIEDYIDMNLSPMLLNRNGQLIICGCVKEDTKVITKQGICEIKDLKKNTSKLEKLNKKIYGINGFNTATDIFDNGIKDTKIITTENNYSIECTHNHPLLILNTYGEFKWKKAKDITYNDYLCVSFGQNSFGDDNKLPKADMKKRHNKLKIDKISKDFAYFIGMWLAEGSNYKEESITISNSEFNSFVEHNDLGLQIKNKRKDNIHWDISSRLLIRTMKKLGVNFTTCTYKDIPKSVYGWKKELIVEFIKGYADGDGCVTDNRVKFTSTSKKLLKNLQILLLNFGIISSLTEFDARNKYLHYKIKSRHIRYDLTILAPYTKKYSEEIGFRFKRKNEKLSKIKDTNRKIPNTKYLLKKALESSNKKTNIKYCHHIYSKENNKFNINKLSNFIIDFEKENADKKIVQKLKDLMCVKYHYVKPKKIEDSKSHTLDFIIPETHSFVSNGIMSHNTPKSESDIFSSIKKRIEQDSKCPWHSEKFPAILDYEKRILQCPDRFTWDQLMEKRLTMGPLKFAREYQLEFFSREKSLFPKRIIQPAKDKGLHFHLLDKADNRGKEWLYVAGVDVARSGSVSADYTVAIVLAYNCVTQAKQIVHFWREKGLKISEQAKHIANITRKFNNCQVLVEQNNFGQDMIDDLADNYNVGVESFITGGKGQKKEELIRFLISAFEHEQIIIPQGDEWTREEMTKMENELSKFCVSKTPAGNEKFEGLGSHDDSIISLALANKATQIMGMPFAVSDFGDGGTTKKTNPYGNLLSNTNKESDLVKLIRLGVIK